MIVYLVAFNTYSLMRMSRRLIEIIIRVMHSRFCNPKHDWLKQ